MVESILDEFLTDKYTISVHDQCAYSSGLYYVGPCGLTGPGCPGKPQEPKPKVLANCCVVTIKLKESNEEDYINMTNLINNMKDPEIKTEISKPTRIRGQGISLPGCEEEIQACEQRNKEKVEQYEECVKKLESLGVECDYIEYVKLENTDKYFEWFETYDFRSPCTIFCHSRTQTYLWLLKHSLVPYL